MKHQKTKNRSDTVKLDCVQSTSKVLAISKYSSSFPSTSVSSPQNKYTTAWVQTTQQVWQLQNQKNAGCNIKINTMDTRGSKSRESTVWDSHF